VVRGSQPEITLNGPLDQKWEAGVAYVDPSGTITDPFEGDLSRLLSSDAGEKVDVSTPGMYTVTYLMTAPDAQNLLANSKTRTVTVADTIEPVGDRLNLKLRFPEDCSNLSSHTLLAADYRSLH
jgi:hypothetical protein